MNAKNTEYDLEKHIIFKTLYACLNAGYSLIGIDDGNEYITRYAVPTNADAFWAHINSTNECRIVLEPPQPHQVGFDVKPGTGWDVIRIADDDFTLADIIMQTDMAIAKATGSLEARSL